MPVVLTLPDVRPNEEAAAVLLPGRVLAPEQVGTLLSWQDMDDWLAQQRAHLLGELRDEMQGLRAQAVAQLQSELAQVRAAHDLEVAASWLRHQAALQDKARTLAGQMAASVADTLKDFFTPGGELESRYFDRVLRELELQVGRSEHVVVHINHDDVPAFAHALGRHSAQLARLVQLRPEADVQRGQCIVRTEERLIEIEVGAWLNAVEEALAASGEVALAGSAAKPPAAVDTALAEGGSADGEQASDDDFVGEVADDDARAEVQGDDDAIDDDEAAEHAPQDDPDPAANSPRAAA